ncbi:MAG TPA: winged helix-turn-helix transcriptional regulator [bacterium]|nr:winged helix-turn-helix transcriptional regulator [bacterium]
MVSDREFIDLAGKGLKIEAQPLRPLAEKLGLSQAEVIARIKRLIAEGKVRRFAASVRHQPIGFSVNAMVIAHTDEAHIDEVGNAGQRIEAVSHCYHRAHPNGDPWCVYIMVHGQGQEVVDDAVAQIRRIPGVREVEVCPSRGELKKTSLSGVSADPDLVGG